jgi:stearoyl-CoA desaturase (delta-9 desaturase)
MLALLAAVPLARDWGLNWLDVGLAVGFYLLSGLGVTVGFHRYFTHRAFKAKRWLRRGLAIAGSLALQGDVITRVADHRHHHAFADKEVDPHSPWLFGTAPAALAKGFWHAHTGWLSPATGPTPRVSPRTCSPAATSDRSAASSPCGPPSACSPQLS